MEYVVKFNQADSGFCVTYPNFCFIAIYIRDVKENPIKVGHRNINGLWFHAIQGTENLVNIRVTIYIYFICCGLDM